jgi:colanic acid/amylovoran biosynthesis glycosyltransferase
MRVLYIIGTYPLLTTTFVDREIRSLRRLGVDVQIIAVRKPDPEAPLSQDQRLLEREVTYLLPCTWRAVARSNAYFLLRRPRRYVTTFVRLATRPHPHVRARLRTLAHFGEGVYAAYLVRRRSCDELHAHFADRAATIALVAGRLLGLPYSMSVHAGADIFVSPVLLPEKVRAARRVVTCTAHNKARLLATVGPDVHTRVAVVQHGLDLDAYEPSRAECRPPAVLAVGQLQERKGFTHLIEACSRLRTAGYEFSCRIVGDGPMRDALRAHVEAAGMQDAIELCGALPHEQVIREYEQASVFVLPCVEATDGDVDGIPNVLLEAMACHVAVLSSDLPAIRELVANGDNGLLVDPGDPRALAAALARLLDSRTLRDELATNARRTVVEMFDAAVNVTRFAAALWPARFTAAASTGPERR